MSNEVPHIQDGIVTLMQRWGNECWLLDARQFKDDAGLRLEVLVVDGLYREDVLPRRLVTRAFGESTTCYLVVRRVADPVPGARDRRLLAAVKAVA